MNRVRHIPWAPRHENVMPINLWQGVPVGSRLFAPPFGLVWIPVPGWGLN